MYKLLKAKLLLLLSLPIISICANYNNPSVGNDNVNNEPYFFEKHTMPPSPSVAGLQGFVEANHSHYNGRANISIPLWSVESDVINFSLSADYSSNGIKVNDVSGIVGMGWNISNMGGSINRVVKGKADEQQAWSELSARSFKDFYKIPGFDLSKLLNTVKNLEIGNNKGVNAWITLMHNLEHEAPEYNIEIDKYNYNFFGNSGSFYLIFDETPQNIEKRGPKVLQVKESDLKIECIYSFNTHDGRPSRTSTNIDGFKISDKFGREYYFGIDPENSELRAVDNSLEYPSSGEFTQMRDHRSAWHLTEVRKGNHNPVSFKYKTHTEYSFNPSESILIKHNESNKNSSTWVIKHETNKISQIIYDKGNLNFNYNEERKDMHNNLGFRLKSIKVTGLSSGLNIRSIAFNNKYIISNHTPINSFNENRRKRLFLEQIIISGGNVHTSNPYSNTIAKEYYFKYNNPEKLPPRFSKAQDKWGFYNGRIDNSSLIPSINSHHINYQGADRSINKEKTKYGLLKEITYPTGGKAKLTYKQNTYRTKDIIGIDSNFGAAKKNKKNISKINETYAGGVKVTRIDYYDNNNKLLRRTKYSYKKDDNKSSGILAGGQTPKFHKAIISPGDFDGPRHYPSKFDMINSSPVNNIEYTQGNTVGYQKVKKTHINYNNPQESKGTEVFLFKKPIINSNVEIQEINNLFNFSEDLTPRYMPAFFSKCHGGTLLEHHIYNNDNLLIKKNIYNYEKYNSSDKNIFVPFIRTELLYKETQADINLIKNSLASIYFGLLPVEQSFLRKTQTYTKENFYDYDNNLLGSTENITKYHYNNEKNIHNPELIEIFDSNAKTLSSFVYYDYLEDEEGNYYNYVTRERRGFKTGNSFNVKNGYFAKYNSGFQPTSIFKEFPGTIDKPCDIISDTIEYKNLEYYHTEIGFTIPGLESYRKQRKLKQKTYKYENEGDFYITYLWGYGFVHPIAKIKNASFDMVNETLNNNLNLNIYDLQTKNNAELSQTINILRDELPNAKITSYTYNSHNNISTATDERNHRQNFGYNNIGMLTRISDMDRKIIKNYDYYYVNMLNNVDDGNNDGNGDNNGDEETSYRLFIDYSDNGLLKVNGNDVERGVNMSFNKNENVNILAKPDKAFILDKWYIDEVPNLYDRSQNITILMNDNRKIKAEFRAPQLIIKEGENITENQEVSLELDSATKSLVYNNGWDIYFKIGVSHGTQTNFSTLTFYYKTDIYDEYKEFYRNSSFTPGSEDINYLGKIDNLELNNDLFIKIEIDFDSHTPGTW